MVALYNENRSEQTIVTGLVISQSYGLYRWTTGRMGGQTLVKKRQDGSWSRSWTIPLGTSWVQEIRNLQKWGVPKSIAQDLVQKMNAQGETDRYAGE